MRASLPFRHFLQSLLLISSLPARVLADESLETTGFSNCISNATITVTTLDLTFDATTSIVTFNVAGQNSQVQNISASVVVTAYGKDEYSKSLNPCDTDTYISELCPGKPLMVFCNLPSFAKHGIVPSGDFAAQGSYNIPSEYSSLIPAIAYNVPNLDINVQLNLTSLDSGNEVACVAVSVSNGKTAAVPAAKYAAVGVAGAALVVSGVSAIAGVGSGIGSMSTFAGAGSAGHVGAAHSSPSFTEVVGWFQAMAMNGMLSVAYPSIYRSYTQNFGFSTGIISWTAMQNSIDSFRAKTGGNLTDDSVAYLANTTTVYSTDLTTTTRKRSLDSLPLLMIRSIITSVNGSSTTVDTSSNMTSTATASTSTSTSKSINYVEGIKGYVEELSVPSGNVFMTLLLFFAVVLASIAAGILLFKVILEVWALFNSFPKKLTNFRRNFWWILAKALTTLILLLYGVWTLWAVYQFKNGDSWAVKLLAGLTMGLFTAVLLGFTFAIWRKAHDVHLLYNDKDTWRKYSLFYENYKQSYWWVFVPAIIYMFAKGVVIAGAEGHGLVQTAGQLIIESIMLIMLLWSRPYALKSGNWINIIISVTRVVSCACILLFVEALGFSQTTKTATGYVLVVVQGVLTGVLAILILINALVNLFRANPHRRRRKEMGKAHPFAHHSARRTRLLT